ncbi:MAG: MscL family protein [Patescibacteria group bacterium]|nr:MscL family protein [Patescibacteria group bacterium]
MESIKEFKKNNKFLSEFFSFLKEYKIIGLGIAVVVGGAVRDLSTSLAEDIIMPIVEVLIPGGGWREAVLKIGPVQLSIGSFLGSVIDFLIIALVVFIFYKFILGKEEIDKVG